MSGLYIHIPFCRSKCFYCDFFSSASKGDYATYTSALLREWEMRCDELSEPVTTIYIGGGTPSILPVEQLQRLIAGLEAAGVSPDNLKEFTIEANPEDITPERLRQWAGMGIDRVSIGIQSFDRQKLNAIGRRHSPEASLRALEALSESGFNFSADLIYGLPGQSLEEWAEDLDTLLSFNPPHISCYLLSYEPRTRLFIMREKGLVTEPDEELATAMYDLLCETARSSGYLHYEISNFALPGKEARHNSSYWDYTQYLGLGCGAHSMTSGGRLANLGSVKAYTDAMAAGQPFATPDVESDEDRLNDYIITSLRTAAGFDRRFAMAQFPSKVINKFDRNLASFISIESNKSSLRINSSGDFAICEKIWLRSDAILRELIVD